MRYQVLYDNVDSRGKAAGGGILNVRTKTEANRKARHLREAGKLNVHVWDTQDNALSRLFPL